MNAQGTSITSTAADTDVLMTDMSESEQPLYKTYDTAANIVYTPEAAFKHGLRMVKTIRTGIEKLHLGSEHRRDVWMRKFTSLEDQALPKTLIAICGGTGAGKSSIINAILDENIVPTSGMHACTAVVTEIGFHNNSTIEADVSFLSLEEWQEELSVLLTDLNDEDGNVKRSSNLKSDAGIAWSKVNAVYPKLSEEINATMTAEQIVRHDPRIAAILGTSKKIIAEDSKIFSREISRYINSQGQNRGKKKGKNKGKSLMDKMKGASIKQDDKNKDDLDSPAFWPLIKQVKIKCSSPVLSTGAILVDLPGVADANAARNNIAKVYMQKCNYIFVVAPITRAVDDKTARDLLGEAFRMQLMMDGSYDDHTITFIATKCDDISCSEVIGPLHLQDDETLEDIEESIDAKKEETKEHRRAKASATKVIKALDKEMEGIRAIIKEHNKHLDRLKLGEPFTPTLTPHGGSAKKRKNRRPGKKGSPKRRRNDSDDDSDAVTESDTDSDEESSGESKSDNDSDESNSSDNETIDDELEVTPEVLEDKITELEAKLKDVRTRYSEALKQKKEARDALGRLSKSLIKLQREKNGHCSRKRSEFARDALKQDFRIGVKDLDDTAAEARDPDSFDPTVNLRDYDSIDLPVFTVSSRDYMRLKGQVTGDGEPSCFSNVNDTGVLDLQEWCHTLTFSSRQRRSRNFLSQLTALATSIHSYVKGVGEVTPADRAALRERWESSPQSYDSDAVIDDPFAAVLGGGSTVYSIKSDPPKMNAYGQEIGVTPELAKEFTKVISNTTVELQKLFRDGLEEKCRVGAANAAAAAVTTSDQFAADMPWQTYRATLRRHGVFRRNLNIELVSPFVKNIARTWGKLFEIDLFSTFEKATLAALDALLQEVEDSAAAGLKDRVKTQGEQCRQEAKVELAKVIEVMAEKMQAEQKEINRSLAPRIQEQLIEGYDRARNETGIGSVARQKALFHNYVNNCKDTIFDDGADVILDRLEQAAEAVGNALDEALGQLAEKVEVNLAVLWEDSSNSPEHVAVREQFQEVASQILHQTQLWVHAKKLSRQKDVAVH